MIFTRRYGTAAGVDLRLQRVAEVVDLRLEGARVKADGQQGYFLQRMTPIRLKRSSGLSGGITFRL